MAARTAHWAARTPLGLAVLRHREAGLLLRDRRLRQGSHAWPKTIGITGTFADFWKRSVISCEGERLRTLRQIVQSALAEDFVLSLVPAFEHHAEALLDRLRGTETFDALRDITEPFAGLATASVLGVADSQALAIANDASALGLAMGPEAPLHKTVTNAACERLLTRAEHLLASPPSTGIVPRMIAEAGRLSMKDRQALIDLVVIAIFGGVDTTRAQLAFAVMLFAQHPDQWAWLRENPNAVGQALDEVIRWRPTTTWATRQAVEDFHFGGVDILRGTLVHILVHASSTDPATSTFEGFDIRTKRKRHFGFGGGAHHCLGHFVARTDISAALRVMLRNWKTIEIAEPPAFMPDSGNTSPTKLKIAPVWERALSA